MWKVCRVFYSRMVLKPLFSGLAGVPSSIKSWCENYQKQDMKLGCTHTYHIKVSDLTPEEFRRNTELVIKTLEDITGNPVTSYRAPGFSVNRKTSWAFEILSELVIEKDSSL